MSESQPSIHRALKIPEILDAILSCVPIGSLPRVARTARYFHAPAARLIWREVNFYGLDSLVDIVWKPLLLEKQVSEDVKAASWRRFRLYGDYIEDLVLELADALPPHHLPMARWLRERLVAIAGLPRPQRHLLPRLQYFCIQAEHLADLEVCVPLLGPSIMEIQLICPNQPNESHARDFYLGSLLYRMRHEVPGLQGLTFTELAPVHALCVDALRDLITNAQDLLVFGSGPAAIKPAVLTALAGSAKLRELRIAEHLSNNGSSLDVSCVPACVGAHSFRSLQILEIEGNLAVATAILSCSQARIKELRIESRQQEHSGRELQEFGKSVQSSGTRMSKCVLLIQESKTRPSPFLWEALSGLLACGAITHFHFKYHSSTPFDIRNCHVEAMAAAWPSLKTLIVTWGEGDKPSYADTLGLAHTGKLTTASWASLAVHCPNLTECTFSGLHDSSDLIIPSQLRGPRKAVRLNTGWTKTSRPEHIALFLDTIWPNVSVRPNWLPSKPEAKNWDSVSLILKAFRGQRELGSRRGALNASNESSSSISLTSILPA